MGSVIIFTQIAPPVRMRNEHWQRKLSEDFALITKLREFSIETGRAESLVAVVCEALEVRILSKHRDNGHRPLTCPSPQTAHNGCGLWG
jgi:hypothetical protein